MAMKQEPIEDGVETSEDEKLFESVWVKAETVVVTPDYLVDEADAKPSAAKNPLQKRKAYKLKTLSCTQCDFTTVHGNSLKYHMLTHTDERPFSCEYCDFTSKFPPILKRHMNTVHGDLVLTKNEPELFACNKCNYTTTIKQNLKGHVRKHKKDKQFKCTQCSFETAYRHNFVKHNKTHQQDLYRCDKCTFETKFHGHITRHMEQIHNEIIEESKHICEFCQTTSKEKWKLRRHKERSIMKQAMRCVFCDYETIYRCQMRKHKRMHDNEQGESSFVLAAAAAATITEIDGKTIEPEPQTQQTMYKCDKCTFETRFQGHITRHLESIHNEIIESAFMCEHCNATFTEKYKLRQHTTKSFLKQNIKCPDCDFGTSYKCQLRRHKRLEHNTLGEDKERYENFESASQKPNETVIQKAPSSTDKGINNTNVPVNLEDGVIMCDRCPFKTLYEADMTKHTVEVHNICKLCSHNFGDKWSLNVHIIKSKSEYIVKCSYCDFGSFYRCEIRTHTNTHFTELCGLPKEDNNTGELRNLLNYYMNDTNLSKNLAESNLPKTATETQRESIPYYRQPDGGPSTTQMYQESTERVDNNQIGQSKFGQYLIDQNCVDWRSIQVIESNDSVNRYKCPLCDFPSKFKACVQRHFQRHHTGHQNRPYKCVNCDFSTKTKDAIALHNKRNPTGPVLHCQICNYTTNYKCAFNSHQKFHYAHKCKVCKCMYKHKHELIRHVATKHLGKGIKCNFCDFVALRKDSMASHMLSHTGVKPFQCNVCEYGTVRKTLLDIHMRKRHGIVERVGVTMINKSKIESLKVPPTEETRQTTAEPKEPIKNPEESSKPDDDDVMMGTDDYIDPINDDPINADPMYNEPTTEYQDQYNDYVDMLSQEDVKPDIHKLVEVKVPTEPSHEPTEFLPIPTMDAEDNSGNKEENPSTFACDQCEYTSTVITKLAAHISRKHDTNKQYKCILCPFRTSHKTSLAKHRELHKKGTAYKCNICSFKTKSKAFIIRHLSTVHNKTVKTGHVCVYCNTSTLNKQVLAGHLKRNRAEKAMLCDMCNFETIYKCHMKKHTWSHLREEKDEKDETLTKPKARNNMYTKINIKKRKSKKQHNSDDSDEASDADNTFKCENCSFETLKEKEMLKHFVKKHNGCKYCGRAFNSTSELEEHIKTSKADDVKCLFCDFDSDYKCETCKHMCLHFTGFNGFGEDVGVSLQDRIASVMDSIESQTKTDGTEKETDKSKDNDEDLADDDGRNAENSANEDGSENIGLQVQQNKFGNFLVDPNCIDFRTLKVQKMADNDAFQCPSCEFTTKYRTSMQRHIQRNHSTSKKRPYRCIDCGFSAKSKDSIRKHNQRKISRKILFCTRCEFTATVKCALAVHQKRHFKLKCKACSKIFNYKRALIAHFAFAHLKIGLKCQFCDFYASLKETIVDHETTHTGLKAYQCSVCEYSVNRRRLLQEHFKRYHCQDNKNIKPFKAKNSDVKIKTEMSGSNEIFSCDMCDYTDVDKSKLVAHIKRKHTLTFMCEKCPYTTPYKGALKTHSLTHSKYSIYKCTKCPYETAFKGRIISHLEKLHNVKIEDKDAKLICEFCNEKQRSYYMLKMHEEKGRFESPTKCKSCEFVAIYKCQMEKHEKAHILGEEIDTTAGTSEEKLYIEERITENILKCRFCNFIASKRGTVSRHEATHAEENRFKCNLCGFTARKNILLMAHWKKHHNRENRK